MNKNLILGISVFLVLGMIASVSALPSWMTGKVTDRTGVMTVYENQLKQFSLNGQSHSLEIKTFSAGEVVLILDSVQTNAIVKGGTQTIGNLKIDVTGIKKKSWVSKNRVSVVVSLVSGGTGETPTTPSTTSGEVDIEVTMNLIDGPTEIDLAYMKGDTWAIGNSPFQRLAIAPYKKNEASKLVFSPKDYHTYFIASSKESFNESYYLTAYANSGNEVVINKARRGIVCDKKIVGDECIIGNVILKIKSVNYISSSNYTIIFESDNARFDAIYSADGSTTINLNQN